MLYLHLIATIWTVMPFIYKQISVYTSWTLLNLRKRGTGSKLKVEGFFLSLFFNHRLYSYSTLFIILLKPHQLYFQPFLLVRICKYFALWNWLLSSNSSTESSLVCSGIIMLHVGSFWLATCWIWQMEQLPGDSMPALHWVSRVLRSIALTKDKLQLGCWQGLLRSPLSGLSNLAAQSP